VSQGSRAEEELAKLGRLMKQWDPTRPIMYESDGDPQGAADVARITVIWRDARARFGEGGPFLFGAFGAADAMFAPVVARFAGYGIGLDPVSAAYAEAVQATRGYKSWRTAALAEPWIIEEDEADEPVLEDFRPHLSRSKAQ